MKTRLAPLVLLAAAACGGNWSNRDLDFANALPDRASLRSKLPTTVSGASPLEGAATRRDGLNVGDPSQAYAFTKEASTNFNGLLDFLLGVVDTVRALPPTTRTKDSRIWGPWPDRNNPGFEFAVAIQQRDERNFEWAIRSRPKGGEFFDLVTGAFLASASARKGMGAMVVHVRNFRDVLNVDANLKQLDEIQIGYITDTPPRRVEMAFTFAAGSTTGLSGIGFTYREQDDRSGAMRFRALSPGNADVTVGELTSLWQPSGAGRATSVVIQGLRLGYTVEECWDAAFKVTYYRESWPGGQTSGLVGSCVTVPGL